MVILGRKGFLVLSAKHMVNRIRAQIVCGKVKQDVSFRVNSCVSGWNACCVGDIVFLNCGARCPEKSIGFIRELGADGFGTLIIRVDLIKQDPMSWPRGDLWCYQDELIKSFDEKWPFQQK